MESEINPRQIIEYEKEVAFYLMNVLSDKEKATPMSIDIELESAVEYIEKRAKFYSNIITDEILSLQEECISYFAQLDQRLKKRGRIVEKIMQRIKVDEMDIKDAVSSISDTLRYTIIIDDSVYIEKLDEYLRKIENMGYNVIKFKNAWGNEFYQGINVVFCDEHGFKFEIQFHTPNGYAIKEGKLRNVYNIIRDLHSPKDLVEKCNAIRRFYQAQVRIPDGAMAYEYHGISKKRG